MNGETTKGSCILTDVRPLLFLYIDYKNYINIMPKNFTLGRVCYPRNHADSFLPLSDFYIVLHCITLYYTVLQ